MALTSRFMLLFEKGREPGQLTDSRVGRCAPAWAFNCCSSRRGAGVNRAEDRKNIGVLFEKGMFLGNFLMLFVCRFRKPGYHDPANQDTGHQWAVIVGVQPKEDRGYIANRQDGNSDPENFMLINPGRHIQPADQIVQVTGLAFRLSSGPWPSADGADQPVRPMLEMASWRWRIWSGTNTV